MISVLLNTNDNLSWKKKQANATFHVTMADTKIIDSSTYIYTYRYLGIHAILVMHQRIYKFIYRCISIYGKLTPP